MPNPKILLATVAVAFVATFSACGGSDTSTIDRGTVIRNVTVVDTRNGALAPGRNVVVADGRIQQVTDQPVEVTGSAQAIDAGGRYLVPGFLDMHTHLLNASPAERPLIQKLLVANGITGIREMGGAPDWIAQVRQHNADRAAGATIAPEILQIPGQIIGIPPTGIPSFDVGAPAEAMVSASAAAATVRAQKAGGVDFVKTIAANREAALGLLVEAKLSGLDVAGHLTPWVSALEASAGGWRAIEHLGGGGGLMLDCSSDEAAVRADVLAGAAGSPPALPANWTSAPAAAPLYQRLVDTFDADKCRTLASSFALHGTWQVPTLVRIRTGLFAEEAQYQADPDLIYVSKSTRAAWLTAAQQRAAAYSPAQLASYHAFYERARTLPLLFKSRGVKMLAGSDMSINPFLTATWVVPGASLHREFQLLADAGLTPLDVLQMTTLNGAQFLRRESRMGTVEPGRNADLVLLDADPLQGVANLGRIAGVFQGGRYFPKEALAQMKAEVAAAYEAASATAPASTADHARVLHVH